MGGADKGLVEYQGRPLIEWALAALAPQVGELVISANRNLDTYAAYGHRVLPDTLPDFPGPLAGVLAALEAVKADWLLVVPCDTPAPARRSGARLLAAAQQENVPLAVAADEARVHHSCFIVRTDQRENLAAYLARGERAVRHWQAGLSSTTVRFDAAGFANFNQPQDLQRKLGGWLPLVTEARASTAARRKCASRANDGVFSGGDELGIGELEAVHQRDEVLQRALAAQAGIARLLLADGADAALLVVVRRIDQGVVVEGKKLAAYRVIQRGRVAALEVGAAAGLDQQRVAGVQPAGVGIGEVVVGVAGGVDRAPVRSSPS